MRMHQLQKLLPEEHAQQMVRRYAYVERGGGEGGRGGEGKQK